MSDRFIALYAVRKPGGGWVRFVGDTKPSRLPIRALWRSALTFEDYQGPTRPETDALCRKLSVDVLFIVHIDRSARGRLLREALERKAQHGLAPVSAD